MQSFFFAFQFLTIIPIPMRAELDPKSIPESVSYFPVIGLFLGITLAFFNEIFILLNFPPYLASTLVVVILIVLTGALHLDGLSDTFDALGSFQSKDKALEIMRDSHVGAIGAVSMIAILLLKIAFISALDPTVASIALIATPCLSRWALSFAIWIFPYARTEGKGKDFFAGMDRNKFILATAFMLLIILPITKLEGLALILFVAGGTFIFGTWISKKLGGITGDVLGAINELAEVWVLLGFAVWARFFQILNY